MKKILFILAVCLLAGCTGNEKQAHQGAQQFLDAFLANDYDKAAEFCTNDFQIDFEKVVANFRTLDTNVRALLVSECSQYKAEILSAQSINGTDTFKVDYRIVKAQADTASANNGFIESSLKVVDGKVYQLGE